MALSCTLVKRLIEESCQQNENGIEETHTYRVTYNGFATLRAALTATDGSVTVPAYYAAHPDDSSMRVTRKVPRRLSETPLQFDVEVTYSIPRGTSNSIPAEGDTTTKWDFQIRVEGVENEETVDRDYAGEKITTSAGDTYTMGLSKVFYDEVITVVYKCRSVDVVALGDARGFINSDTVALVVPALNYSRTFPAETLKLGNVMYDLGVDPNGDYYWQVQLPLLYRHNEYPVGTERGWQRLVPDRGFYYLDGSDITRIGEDLATPASDTNLPKETETYLDGSGGILASGDDVVFRIFALEPAIAFAPLLVGIG